MLVTMIKEAQEKDQVARLHNDGDSDEYDGDGVFGFRSQKSK